jgi:hypothetical protein
MDLLRHHVLLVVMPVFFLSTGLRTNWDVGGAAVFVAAAWLLVARWPASCWACTWPGAAGLGRARPASSAGCCRPRR